MGGKPGSHNKTAAPFLHTTCVQSKVSRRALKSLAGARNRGNAPGSARQDPPGQDSDGPPRPPPGQNSPGPPRPPAAAGPHADLKNSPGSTATPAWVGNLVHGIDNATP